jgi:hypothetical protein
MIDKNERYLREMEFFKQPPHLSWKRLMVAVCMTQLRRYPDAMHCYGLALQHSLKDRFWHRTSRPNWLVDAYSLANQPDLYPEVLKEVEDYKLDYRGKSLVAVYACAIAHLLSSADQEAKSYVPELLGKPKVKWTFAIGRIIEALVERNQLEFDVALGDLLKAHHGMANLGRLRETPEGFLCLPAMSLSKLALERGMGVHAESEYLSMGYLDYILRYRGSAP